MRRVTQGPASQIKIDSLRIERDRPRRGCLVPILVLLLLAGAAGGGYLWWQRYERMPKVRLAAAERQAAVEKLKAVRGMIVSRKIDFAAAAKQYSQEANGPMGGVIGFVPRKFAVDEAFARAAFALKPGEISEPVPTEFGVHLIQLNERRQGPGSTWEKAKADAREFYIEEMFQAVLAQQRKAARIEVLLK